MPRANRSSRPFALSDLMILVAAAGVGLAMLRPYLSDFDGPGWKFTTGSIRTIEATYGVWSIVAACWMIALLLLQQRRPRPLRSRLARRPGYVACCVAAVAMTMGGLHELLRFPGRLPGGMPYSWTQAWITVSVRVGPAVAGAWLLLALSGRGRSDPGWIDRLGRFLGCCWIGWMVFWLIPSPIRTKIANLGVGVFP